MYSNQNATQMPGSMPGAIPETTNTNNAMNQDTKHTIGNENVNNINNPHGEHNFSKDKSLLNNATSGLTGNQNNMNPLHSNQEGNNVRDSNDHHYKRDAALATGAAGLAGHEINSHHNNQSRLVGDHHEGVKSNIESGLVNNHHGSLNNNPLQSGLGNNHHEGISDPLYYRSSNDNDHHYKRDAALGTGAAGIAGHELKNHNDKESGLNNNGHGSSNLNQSGLSNNPLHSGSDNINRSSNDNDHHYKRDAALGTGAAGAAGIAGHEMKGHHDKQSDFHNDHHIGTIPLQSGLGPNNEGNHRNPLHSGSDNINRSPNDKDHHYKRDAALGAGAAGIAGHEMKNHHDKQSGLSDNQHTSAGNPLHSESNNNDNYHHYKRDAALGTGAAGAAGIAGHEMKNHHDKQSDLHDDHHIGTNPLQSGLGPNNGGNHRNPLHSGSDNINRSPNDKDHHYKRDAALGAGAVGIVGHEMSNHHDKQSDPNDDHHNGRNSLQSGLTGNHEGIHSNPLHSGSDNTNRSSNDKDHHYKRDAALGAGAGGAAGIAGHEMKDHHDKQSGLNDNQHTGTGNPHHSGSDNINYSSNDKDHHYKRDAALGAGAAGIAGHEMKNHHDKQSGLSDNQHTSAGNPLHSGSDNINRSPNDNDHHYKRDAALGAGAAGIAGHEMKNHHKQSGLNNNQHTGTGNPLHSGSDNINHSPNDKDHHYKRDAALGAGAAGAAGIAGHEMKQHHDDKKGTQSNRTSVSSKSSNDGTGEKKGAAVHDKPLNTGGDAQHIAEQPPLGLGGLTGQQPVGEVNFHKLS